MTLEEEAKFWLELSGKKNEEANYLAMRALYRCAKAGLPYPQHPKTAGMTWLETSYKQWAKKRDA